MGKRNSNNKGRSRRRPTSDSGVPSSNTTNGRNTINMHEDTTVPHDSTFLSGLTEKQINDVGSIPWAYPAGRPQNLFSSGQSEIRDAAKEMTVPGIFTLDLVFGPGKAWDYWSPVNQAAVNQMTFLRANNSRSDSKYQASDLILYEMAVESAFIFYQTVKRAYYVATTWDSQNRYFPDALLKSMGFDAKDFRKHLPQIRSYMDQFMYMIGSLPLPGNLEIFKRHLTYFSNIYEDGESPKAQTYLFKPAGLYIYDEWRRDIPTGSDEPRPGRCGFVHWNNLAKLQWKGADSTHPYGWVQDNEFPDTSEFMTTAQILELMEFIGSTLMSSDDVMRMGADIAKAYGANVWYLDSLDPNTQLQPVYNKDVLLMIHNSRSYTVALNSLNIEQTATGLAGGDAQIRWNPETYSGFGNDHQFAAYNPDILIDCCSEQPTPRDVVNMTRLAPHLGLYDVDSANIECGTIFPVGMHIWNINELGEYEVHAVGNFMDATNGLPMTKYKAIQALTKFDWHPQLWLYRIDKGLLADYILLSDLESWTTIQHSLAKRQNEVDTIAQWRIPETAYYK